MARVALAYATALAVNGNIPDPTGTALVAGAGNGLVVPAAAAQSFPERTLLRVANASGSTATVTVLAGAQPLDIASGQGAVSATVTTGTTAWLGPFESGRVIQNDGSLLVESTQIVTVTAFLVNRH